MEADLLLKEDEFYKENEKLEMCTKQLMLKAQDALVSILNSTLKSVLSNFFDQKTQEHLIQDCFKEEPPSSGKIHVEEGIKTENLHGKLYQAKLKVLLADKEKALQELRQRVSHFTTVSLLIIKRTTK